jgi:hypothetical protein
MKYFAHLEYHQLREEQMKMMKWTGLLWVLAALWAVAGTASAKPTSTGPKLTMAVLCKSYPNKKPTGIAKVFKPGDLKIHCVFRLAKPVQGVARSVWYAVKVEDIPPNTKLYDTKTKSMLLNGGHFTLENSNPWPRGQYRSDIYVNGKKLRSLPYTVK